MRHELKKHPDFHCDAIESIGVDVGRHERRALQLRYFVTGRISDIDVPSITKPARTDGLWQHTCFEAFLRASETIAYCEFNFAPSRQWAAYRFERTRVGISPIDEIKQLHIAVRSDDTRLELDVLLPLGALPELSGDVPWLLGLSAVIEEKNGQKSYWALAHPPGNPDFHHSDCFALTLPAPLRP